MTPALERYQKYSRRRRRRAGRARQRLDIQGLRMVAVLTVLANHLWGWPTGGFIGVDVFFVISGFLITSNLLRMAENSGTVSFKKFYWNRVRRIAPAATVVLLLTFVAATLIFLPFRANKVGIDAIFAFIFMANWHFAIQDTDYFAASIDTVSPVQHYWSLSIEEQFYFVWPALIFIVSVLVIRKAWNHERRMMLAGAVMSVIVVASFGWAIYESSASPTWAYFDTFSRVWELGVGAALATAVGVLARIPVRTRPFVSWLGLAFIAASLFLIADGSAGFPAPWALLPVAGAALVIVAGVGGEPKYQPFLRNPVSGYIGDISYSLYLVHWPVIVFLGALMDAGIFYSLVALAASFGLAIASYHFVENPLRRADGASLRHGMEAVRNRKVQIQRSTQFAAVAVIALFTASFAAYVLQPVANDEVDMTPIAAAAPSILDPSAPDPGLGPQAAVLQAEIVEALGADRWPALGPSIESVLSDPAVGRPIPGCAYIDMPDPVRCTWGEQSAPVSAVIVGNSVAVYYVEALREVAINSGGQFSIHTLALFGCNFSQDMILNEDPEFSAACPGRKQDAVNYINATKPDIVFVSNSYRDKHVDGSGRVLTPEEWSTSVTQLIQQFRGSTQKVVMLSPPPGDVDISSCYGTRRSKPPACIAQVSGLWLTMAKADQATAKAVGGLWVDSRPWFCSIKGYCPSFVKTTPTKQDQNHLVPAYGRKIAPVITETLKETGVF